MLGHFDLSHVVNHDQGYQCSRGVTQTRNRVLFLLQKKQFDGATYNAAGSSYQMQWNIAEGYNIAYQDDDMGSVAVAESMNQVHSECCILTVMGMFTTGCMKALANLPSYAECYHMSCIPYT